MWSATSKRTRPSPASNVNERTESRGLALPTGTYDPSHLLLECTMAGMATCTLIPLIEVDESRDIVRSLIEQPGKPQVLIRAWIAPPMEDLPAPTPRSPLGEALQIR